MQAVNLREFGHHELAPAVKGLAHYLDLVLRAGQCGNRRALGHVIHVGREVRLQVGGALHSVGRANHPAHSPTGHGVRLCHTVDQNGLLGERWHGFNDGHSLDAVIGEVLVDLVRDHPDAVLERPFANGPSLFGRVHRSGRVGRRNKQQHLGFVGARRLQLLDGHQIVLVGAGKDVNLRAAGQRDRLGVGGPVRRGNEYFVTGIEQHLERLVHRLLAAVGDDHLTRRDGQARVAQRLCGDRLT